MNRAAYILLLIVTLAACRGRSNNGMVPMSKESLMKANRGLVCLDQERIESYAERHHWDMQTSQTGLWYQIYEHGDGDSAQTGLTAHINYSVSLLDGTLCYTSDSTGEKTFRIGKGGVESGLEEAILMMRVGDKGRFIMPPHLAHGLLGDENKIPARSIIVYKVDLINLTR